MAWRDRWRRPRRAESPAGVTSVPGAGEPGTTTVPAGWDGGWRSVAAPDLTLSRAPLAVSDGLVFRAGLAAWRDPSFDRGLAHGVLPTAPAGIVRGIARPAASAGTFSGGGPLLLRAPARYGEEDIAVDADETAPMRESTGARPGGRGASTRVVEPTPLPEAR
ncbi:hypothetical protein NX794_02565, partial [Streptomyces sp. LP11]|nr:hypothetical protein [Streptomyces sp. LP11]